jgi:pimeloyl-ACP methyl ester carboxylesterase
MRPTPEVLWAVRHFFALNFPGAASRIRRGNFAHLEELLRRWSPGWDPPKGETDAVKAALSPAGHLEAAIGYYKALSPILPKSLKRRVEVPAVAFAGDSDVVAPAYERARPHYRASYEVVNLKGGHFMHREHPADFNRELVRVLQPYR